MTETILGQERISRLFFRYSIPGIAAMLFLGLNTIVDGLFAGHYIGADALASVNIAMPFSSLMIALSIMIGIGAQSLIGRKLGAGKTTEAADTFRTALLLCLGFSLFCNDRCRSTGKTGNAAWRFSASRANGQHLYLLHRNFPAVSFRHARS